MSDKQEQLSNALLDMLGLKSGTIKFHTLRCASCQAPIVLPEDIYRARLEDGKSFQCYNGHNNVFTESENDKLKEKINSLLVTIQNKDKRIEWCNDQIDYWRSQYHTERNRVNGYKGYISKLKKKCP